MSNGLTMIIMGAWGVLTEMAPYLLFGFLVAGILSVVLSPETIQRHLGGRGLMPVFKAALFGVPLPLCSCGVIPVSASLRRHGASRGATTAFLLSTPQTGVDSISVTLGLLGPVFAIFRPIAALVTGVFGGALVTAFESHTADQDEAPPRCEEACCTGDGGNRMVAALRYAFVTLPRDIGRALIVGLIAVGLISALVPDDYFASALGTGLVPMLVMMLVGVPLYVCATASVPVAAELIAKGISPGAALVFLMTGPATNAATIAVIWKTMGRRTTVIYLAAIAVCALASGFLLDAVYTASGTSAVMTMHQMLPGYVNTGSAIVLVAMLAYALLKPATAAGHDHAAHASEQTVTLAVTGMTCAHCVEHVRQALAGCPGVESAEVDLGKGQAVVHGDDFEVEKLVQAIEAAGYQARPA